MSFLRFAQQDKNASFEDSRNPLVPNPQNDLKVAQRFNELNDLNGFQYMEFSARSASNTRAVGLSMKK
jgi:hypothetical protein